MKTRDGKGEEGRGTCWCLALSISVLLPIFVDIYGSAEM